jgi:hypothetical protein
LRGRAPLLRKYFLPASGKIAHYFFVNGVPPLPIVYWNHRVGESFADRSYAYNPCAVFPGVQARTPEGWHRGIPRFAKDAKHGAPLFRGVGRERRAARLPATAKKTEPSVARHGRPRAAVPTQSLPLLPLLLFLLFLLFFLFLPTSLSILRNFLPAHSI